MTAYQEALTLRPLDNGALLGIANALVREKKFAEAEAKFQQVLNQSPNNADAMAGLGFVRLNKGDLTTRRDSLRTRTSWILRVRMSTRAMTTQSSGES